MNKQSKIYLAGHEGLVGSAIYRSLIRDGYTNVLTITRSSLDLINQAAVQKFFKSERPEYVIHAAGRIGGIKANITYPAEFLYENMMITGNVIWSAHQNNVKKLIYISCGCSYPTKSEQPIKEEYLLTGVPEPTNEGLTLAKISGIKLCQTIAREYKKNFISCIPANTYGENDHYDEMRSHVISALMQRFHSAKKENLPEVTMWGTGAAHREFIYVDDLADAILFLMNTYDSPEVLNIGGMEEVSMKELAAMIKKIVGYRGVIKYDTTKPDGMLRRSLDSSKIKALGFSAKTSLEEGLKITYEHFLKRV